MTTNDRYSKKYYYRYLRAYDKTAARVEMNIEKLSYDDWKFQSKWREQIYEDLGLTPDEINRELVIESRYRQGHSLRNNWKIIQDRVEELKMLPESELTPEQKQLLAFKEGRNYTFYTKNARAFRTLLRSSFDFEDDYYQYLEVHSPKDNI